MATLVTINAIKITVYANDHLPPHFHVRTVDEEALIKIDDLTVLVGSISAATRKAAWPWITENLPTIRAEWNRLHPNFPA